MKHSTAPGDRTSGRWGRFFVPGLLALVVLLLAAGQLADVVSRWAEEALHGGVERALLLALDPAASGTERRRVFIVDRDDHPTPGELSLFAEAFHARYGALKSVAITLTTRDEDGLDMTASTTLRTERGDVLAAVRFRLVPIGTRTEAALHGVRIFDRAHDALVVGVVEVEPEQDSPDRAL